jgi:Alkylmercury lyase
VSDDCCAPAGASSAAATSATVESRSGPLVEVFYFDGCPNHEPALALVEHVARELGLSPEIRLVHVPDQDAAQRLRFLGSPTIRVAGRDVDPHSEERSDYALSCRVFRTSAGIVGQPDERWVREALLRERALTDGTAADGSPRTAEALAATGIPSARLGDRRGGSLSGAERAFYRWILRSFANEGPPAAASIRAHATELGLDLEQTRARLAAEDLVHFDQAGRVTAAYPFSARPRGHRVLLGSKHSVEAMCAIDALGIAPMLGLPVEISSRDPISGAEVWVRVEPGDGPWWEPKEAVVLAASTCGDGPSLRGCCDILNFFESTKTAERYLADHPEVSGLSISIPEASKLGRAVFGDVLKEA